MQSHSRAGRAHPETWAALVVFFLPILIGVIFWADGTGHGDSIAYRQMIEATWAEGFLPIAKLEWYHPGQYLIAAPIFGLGQWLGLWSEPLQVCSLLNFVGLGLAGWTMSRLMRLLFPDRSVSLALFAGLATVTVPGWLWHEQEGMTDVLGHALILTWSARLLMHECRARAEAGDETRGISKRELLALGFTGFLATYSILIRVSSAVFGLLFVYLWIRLLVATPSRPSRIKKTMALLIGGALPVLGIFSHLILQHGWTHFWTVYLEFSADNTGLRVPVQQLWDVWFERIANGTGPVLLWGGASGMVLLLLLALRPGAQRIFSSRSSLLVIGLLLTFPYFLAVARNRAWYEFRYQLPAMMLLSLATIMWAWIADRFLGRWATRSLILLLVLANLIHAAPWLYVMGTRSPYIEVAVKETVRIAEPGSLLFGHSSGSHLAYRAKGRYQVLPLRVDASEEGIDTWNISWSKARESLQNAYGNGRAAYGYNEPALKAFMEDLATRGWSTKVMETVPAGKLRNALDPDLATMDLETALKERSLTILRLVPPPDLVPLVELELREPLQASESCRLSIHAPNYRGWRFHILFAKETIEVGQLLPGKIQLPFQDADPLMKTSSEANPESVDPIRRLVGTLDQKGRALVILPKTVEGTIRGSYVTVLIHSENQPWWWARLRSPIQRLP